MFSKADEYVETPSSRSRKAPPQSPRNGYPTRIGAAADFAGQKRLEKRMATRVGGEGMGMWHNDGYLMGTTYIQSQLRAPGYESRWFGLCKDAGDTFLLSFILKSFILEF